MQVGASRRLAVSAGRGRSSHVGTLRSRLPDSSARDSASATVHHRSGAEPARGRCRRRTGRSRFVVDQAVQHVDGEPGSQHRGEHQQDLEEMTTARVYRRSDGTTELRAHSPGCRCRSRTPRMFVIDSPTPVGITCVVDQGLDVSTDQPHTALDGDCVAP